MIVHINTIQAEKLKILLTLKRLEFSLALLFIMTCNARSQEWIFDVKLNLKPVSWLTFKNQQIEQLNDGLFFNLIKINTKPFYHFVEDFFYVEEGYVTSLESKMPYYRMTHPKYFEGEVSVDLFQYKKNLRFGMGWTSQQGIVYSGVLSNGTFSFEGQSKDLLTFVMEGFVFRSHQYYIYADKRFGKDSGLLHHHVISGIGLNALAPSNIEKQNRTFLAFQDNHNGYQVITDRQVNRFYPSLLLKYELEFRTKKGRNILGLNISYNQGLMTVYEHSVTASMTTGESFTSLSKSRGSGFRVGISKSFNLKGRAEFEKTE